MNVLSLFDGMSCGQIALKELGIKVDQYYASEVDKFAMKVTSNNFPNTIQLGDVRNITAENLGTIDLLMGGSPCQNLSIIGNKEGLTTKEGFEITSLEQYLKLKEANFEFQGQSYLFWEYVRILREAKPKYFLLENVKMSKKWKRVFDEIIGVEGKFICSSSVSAARRPRYYWSNLNIGELKEEPITKFEILDDIPYRPLTPGLLANWGESPRYLRGNKFESEKLNTLLTQVGRANMILLDKYKTKFRYLTSMEMARCQTIPEWYDLNSISETQRVKCLGNGWTIRVIMHILKSLKNESR